MQRNYNLDSYVGWTLLPSRHHDVKVQVANTTGQSQYIQNFCLGPAVPVILPESEEKNSGIYHNKFTIVQQTNAVFQEFTINWYQPKWMLKLVHSL